MRTLKLYFYGLLVLLFVIFIVQNNFTLTSGVTLRLNLGFLSLVSIPIPLYLIVPLFFFCGLFLATIIGAGERRRLTREIKQLKSILPEPRPEPKPEPKPEPRPEPKPEPKPDTRPEPGPAVLPGSPKPETGQEKKLESEPKKKPDEGTIVSLGPLVKKTGSPEEPKPPFSS
jgi:uncharacterized integral membrane protein